MSNITGKYDHNSCKENNCLPINDSLSFMPLSLNDSTFVVDEELDNLIKENVSMTWIDNKVSYTCKVCNKTGSHKVNMFNHIETHMKDFQHVCTFCGKIRKTREGLRVHIYMEHKKKEALF